MALGLMVSAQVQAQEKESADSELKNKDIARKSIVAKKSIKAGEIFSEENITCKRPGNGISPMKWNDIIGQTAKYDFEFDEQFTGDWKAFNKEILKSEELLRVELGKSELVKDKN